MRIGLLVLFLFISIMGVYPSNVKFYSINAMHGISMRETFSICKDDNGFVWASSKIGVLRVTEGDCRIYQLPYESSNIVSVKLVYKKRKLLAYTSNGQIFIYDELYDHFTLLLNLRKETNSLFLDINRLIIDDEGVLFIATNRGLYKYENTLTLIKETVFDDIAICDNSNLFCSTQNGIELVNIKTLDERAIYEKKTNMEFLVSRFFYDKKNERLWVGTLSDGLFYYDTKDKLFTEVSIKKFPKQPVLAIEENTDSTLLVGIDGQGIWEIDRKGERVLNIYKEDLDDPTSIRGDGIYDIFRDANKKIWVATYSGGLSFFEQESPLVTQVNHRINSRNSLNNDYVNKTIQDSKGNIWFATNNGISRWNQSSNSWSTYYQNNNEQAQVFLALCEDNEGNIWAGTYSSGIYVLDKETGKQIRHYSDSEGTSEFSSKFIFDIYKDSQGDIWIASMKNDVICYLSKEKRFHPYSSQVVRTVTELLPGKILLACSYGILVLDKETGEEEVLSEGFMAQDILVIDSDIWIATSGNGLIYYNYETGLTEEYTIHSGLVSNFVNSITYANGYLWLGTENGLCRFNPIDKSVLTYSSIFLLSNVAFNVNAKCRLRNGDVVLGTNNGAIIFDPNMLYYTPLKGRIFFQDISILGRSIRENNELIHNIPVDKQTKISLKHNQNTLAFELLPVGVSSSGSKFSWKMEGLDADWTSPANHSMINYTNIPSGNFELKIKMYDSALSQIIDERSLSIHIIPPYWQTSWFRLILLLSIVTLLYFSLRFYINRLNQRHAEDKIRFFTNTAHDLRTSLTLITAPIEELNKEENLSDKGRYFLNLATEQSARLSFVATQLLDFQKVDVGKGQLFLIMVDIVKLVSQRTSMFEATARKKNIKLEFHSNSETYLTAIDELKMEKVVDNLISNAIKYSHSEGKVEIRLICSNEDWSLEVKDYGLGISDNAKNKLFREFYRGDNVVNSKMVGSGIGLLLVKNYVTMHGGEVSLESKENVGSSFKISIPLKEIEHVTLPTQNSLDENPEAPFEPVKSDNEELLLTETENNSDKKTYILIVEDNNDLQNFLKLTFQENYKITVANDGVEAWEYIQKKAPDLIISDVMMPNMDGFELCRLTKSTFETSHIPIILLTALSEKTQQMEGLGLGADDYITKPFDMNLLTQRMKSIIRNREVVREKALKLIKKPENEQPILANELNDQFVKKAMEVVRDNIANCEFGKEEFASAMHVSSSLLYKKIKALTGQSPVEFIKIIRLDYSLELLHSRKYTITEISELCGFSSVGYFSTVFKKHFGKPPTEILD